MFVSAVDIGTQQSAVTAQTRAAESRYDGRGAAGALKT